MKRYRYLFTLALAASIAAPLSSLVPGAADAGNISACLTAARANLAASSYHTTMMTNYHGKPETSIVDIQKPDRMHEQGPDHEMIAVGNKVWMKMDGGPWKAMPSMGDIGSLVSMDPTKNMKMSLNGSCTDAGMGIWKGQPAHIYKGTTTVKGETVTSTMYQLSDGFVHHIDVDGQKNGISSFDFSNFNSTTISSP